MFHRDISQFIPKTSRLKYVLVFVLIFLSAKHVLAQEKSISLEKALADKIVLAKINGQEDVEFKQVRIRLSLSNQHDTMTSIITVGQGLILESHNRNYPDVIIYQKATVDPIPGNSDRNTELFAYRLNLQRFPQGEEKYSVEAKPSDPELSCTLQNIIKNGGNDKFASQLAIWMNQEPHFDTLRDELHKKLGVSHEKIKISEKIAQGLNCKKQQYLLWYVVIILLLIVIVMWSSNFIKKRYLPVYPHFKRKDLKQGGMSYIFLAYHWKDPKKEFIIKFPSSGSEEKRRLENEGKILTILKDNAKNNHVVKIVEADNWGFNSVSQQYDKYLVLEYIDGCTLRFLLDDKGKLDRSISFEIASQILEALSYLHSFRVNSLSVGDIGVIHRDIKPENIMIARNSGKIYLIDFGIAWHIKNSHKTQVLSPGMYLGTLPYVAPEVHKMNQSTKFDYRADIYSWGAVLYEMLTGKKPLEENISQCKKDLELPAKIIEMIERCMKAQYTDRYDGVDKIPMDLLNEKSGTEEVKLLVNEVLDNSRS